ncbi:MAG: type I phosphomannose isomerase catalytic subunit [Planctomycetia bacterium]|nr:type I phosphomannose isomerase catalytic subunit [Planctomycetia bacterium]
MSTTQPLYPLRFKPIFRRYLWGGRRLGEVLGKAIGPEADYAESWEIVDHGEDQSVVVAGSLEGATLHDLVTKRGGELLGKHHPQSRFPLLFKFLDAQQTLSVQVHPDDARAAKLTPPDYGKTEAWYVIDAQPDSLIFAGLKRGFDRDTLARELHRGTAEMCLHRFEPTSGDCVLLPAGLIHAIGAGLLVAEIQQSSDTTYRLFDWNRVGPDGKPRQLHLDLGLEAVDDRLGPGEARVPSATNQPECVQLAACDKFVLNRWQFTAPITIGGDDRCHILAVVGGSALLDGDPTGKPVPFGGTAILPAACGAVKITPVGEATVLDATLP